MITFAEYLKESKAMTFAEFKEGIQKAYAKYFPKSACSVVIYRLIGYSIFVSCYIAKDKSECPNGYWDNDMMNVCFFVDLPNTYDEKSGVLPETLEVEIKKGSFTIKSLDHMYAYQSEKVGLRKFKGSPEQLIKKFDAAFKKVKATFDNVKNKDLIPDNQKEVVAKKGY